MKIVQMDFAVKTVGVLIATVFAMQTLTADHWAAVWMAYAIIIDQMPVMFATTMFGALFAQVVAKNVLMDNALTE